jgi:membrane-anchored glycerophosphoryl diester phosphodiesterase (GDPDase)
MVLNMLVQDQSSNSLIMCQSGTTFIVTDCWYSAVDNIIVVVVVVVVVIVIVIVIIIEIYHVLAMIVHDITDKFLTCR